MAAYLFNFNPLFKHFQGSSFNKAIASVRNASRVRKSESGRPGHQGFRRQDGSTVKCSTLLYRQFKLHFLPGLNVGIGRVADLYSKVAGKVYITCEKTNLDTNNEIVSYAFKDNPPRYKKYINVIPEPQHKRFKLVEKF